MTPVAFLVFNRPDATVRVFREIAKAEPSTLLVVADGPRPDQLGEAERCVAARAIIDKVDWPCRVLTNYAETNLGCKQRVSSGLDWVFATVDEAIILEDDSLPHPDFFVFCEKLLERYRHDERVMHISGDNFQFGRQRGDASYYFSRYPHVWGWASWRRGWQYYDLDMKLWASTEKNVYLEVFPSNEERIFWKTVWNDVRAGRIDTWDFQWAFACISRKGLAIVPNVNLVLNIGFGRPATHAAAKSSQSSALETTSRT